VCLISVRQWRQESWIFKKRQKGNAGSFIPCFGLEGRFIAVQNQNENCVSLLIVLLGSSSSANMNDANQFNRLNDVNHSPATNADPIREM
jgi:hypothetical protein